MNHQEWINLKRAARRGDVEAQCRVAAFYEGFYGPEEGGGIVRPNPRSAEFWWRKAAEQGDSAAQSNLGKLHWRGHGVARDRKRALQLFRLAARAKVAEAGRFIGLTRLWSSRMSRRQNEPLRE